MFELLVPTAFVALMCLPKALVPDEKNHDVRENKISLKAGADMNDVFVPQKCEQEEIETVLFIQSAVPKIKIFLETLVIWEQLPTIPICSVS